MKPLLVLCLVLLLSACGTPQSATPAPTPQAIIVIYPPDLQPWVDRLGVCADNNPLSALFIRPSNKYDPNISPDEIALVLNPTGEQTGKNFASQVGQEQLVVVVNRDNPISQLSAEELRSIYSGRTVAWQAGSGGTIQVWVLPQDDPVRRVFDQVVMKDQLLTSEARLAPNPVAMLEAVSGEVDAIGFLPASYLNAADDQVTGDIKEVQLEEGLTTTLEQPVVAITQAEPSGILRSLLVCLQSSTP
jgi:hypothetical protein